MDETGLEKRRRSSLAEKGQYTLALSVIAVMLFFAGFPVFLLLFVGVLAFFVWKVFSAETRGSTRQVFEFYLGVNEILREDHRRWYGFEIQETIARGEAITRTMGTPPPLVYFGIGALYKKLGDHSAAVKYLSRAVEDRTADEASITYPPKELREYVRMLRKIERSPAEAPMTSSAIRSLERSRKNRGPEWLEESRALIVAGPAAPPEQLQPGRVADENGTLEPVPASFHHVYSDGVELKESAFEPEAPTGPVKRPTPAEHRARTAPADRKTISEVLHDIYDKNIS